MAERNNGPGDGMHRLYEQVEERTAQAMEELVRRDSFGEVLARVTENVMGMSRIGFDVLDLAVRNLRIAGRQDVTRLGRQLARTEDKLEMVLQAVERLEEELAARDGGSRARGGRSEGGGASDEAASASQRSSGASGDADERSGGEAPEEDAESPSGSMAP